MSERYGLTCKPDPQSPGFVLATVRLTAQQAQQIATDLRSLQNADAVTYSRVYNDSIVLGHAVHYDAARREREIQRRFEAGELVGLS